MSEVFLDKTILYEAVSKIENLTYPKRITSDGNDALAWVEKEKCLSIAFLGNGNIAWMYQDGQNEEFSFLDDLKNFLEDKFLLFIKDFKNGETEYRA